MLNLKCDLLFVLVFFFFVTIISSGDSDSCRQVKKSIKKNMVKSYKYYSEELNWLEASLSCQSKCGELAVIESEKDKKAVFKRLDDKPIKETWIGLVFNKNLYWQNGKPGVSKTSLPFSGLSETNTITNEVGCFGLKNTGSSYEGRQWIVGRCLFGKPYLCQFYKEGKEGKKEKQRKKEKKEKEEEEQRVEELGGSKPELDFEGESQINFWSPMFFFPVVSTEDRVGKK